MSDREKYARELHEAKKKLQSMATSEVTRMMKAAYDASGPAATPTLASEIQQAYAAIVPDVSVPASPRIPDDAMKALTNGPQVQAAKHAARTAESMLELVATTQLLVSLTEQSIKESTKAEKRTFWLTLVSLAIGAASAAAAITSVFLYIRTIG